MAGIRGVIFLVILIKIAASQKVCPSQLGWIPYRGKCYKFISNLGLKYNNAANVCQNDGAFVVSANDADENQFIRDWLKTNDARRENWWTSGLTSKTGQINWQGDGQSSNYTGNWKFSSTEYLVDGKKVIYQYSDDEYGWAISDPFTAMGFICEIDLKEVYRIGLKRRDFDYGLIVDSPALAPRGPHFLMEPESTVIIGQANMVFFECVASGNPEPVYEWLRIGQTGLEPVPLGGRFAQISGRLNILDPVETDENTYLCKVNNEHGTILSRHATLSFGNLGEFPPVQVATVVGEKYRGTQLKCPDITGKPGITYQWFKNSVLSFIRPNIQKHTFISSTGKLFFSELTESDGGTYYCIAQLDSFDNSRNYIGPSQTVSRTSVGFPLEVADSGSNGYHDPVIMKEFIFVYPPVPKRGSTVQLECFAYGTGPLTYSWSKRRGAFPADRVTYQSDNRILVIRNVDFIDEDVYECVVYGVKTGRSDSRTLELQIQAEPYFIYPLTDQHIDIGESLTMHCEALGAPFPTYTWYKDGEVLTSADGMTINSNTLHIAQLDPSQNGMYQCSASNDLGTTFSNGQLRVLQIAPSFEKDAMVKLVRAVKEGDIIIRCNPVAAPKPTFTWSYNDNSLNLQPGNYSMGDHYRLTLDGDLMILDVNTNDEGRYRCAAVNSFGEADDYTDLQVIVSRPPMITEEALRYVYFKPQETVMLRCEGNGVPRPIFTWTKDGTDFSPSENDDRVIQQEHSGSLIFHEARKEDEGLYRCFASNDLGVAVSDLISMTVASLSDVSPLPDRSHSVSVGMPLTLSCVPPDSTPPAEVVWIVRDDLDNIMEVDYSARVTMDSDYSLKFANVIREDGQSKSYYECMAVNTILRMNPVASPRHFINVEGETPAFREVQYVGVDRNDTELGMRGQTFSRRCIFSGYPTPEVHWGRTDNKSFSSRVQFTKSSTELTIENLQYEDAGWYECWADNVGSGEKKDRQLFNIRVDGPPQFIQKPENVETDVGATVEFHCKAEAKPPVDSILWYRNGELFTNSQYIQNNLHRFTIGTNTIRIENVQYSDSMVIQCRLTSSLGALWANAYLNVILTDWEDPQIVTPPTDYLVSAEGLALNLTCGSTGKPDPTITWYKDGVQVTGGRYQILLNGDLHIDHLVLTDAAQYRCEASNMFNTTSAEGTLVVRKKTRIVLKPSDLETTAGQNVRFTCSGTTDPEELHNLQMLWLKDGKAIMPDDRRMMTNVGNSSLTINKLITGDSGTYTCLATNGVDSESASALLTVKVDSRDDESNIGWILGTVLGTLVAACLLFTLIVCYKRKLCFHQMTKAKFGSRFGHKPFSI